MFSNEDLNLLLSVHLFEDHTWDGIEEIRELLYEMGDISCLTAERIWAENGVYGCADNIENALMAIEHAKFKRWSIESRKDSFMVKIKSDLGLFKFSSRNLPRAICFAVLLATGVLTPEKIASFRPKPSRIPKKRAQLKLA